MIHKGAIVLGVLVGAGLGVLLAPEKGSTTRNNLKNEGKDIKDKLVDDLKEVKNDISESAKSGKEKFQEEVKDFKVKASYKAEKVITYLEKQLAILKDKNKAYQTS